ncbi:MAG: hypothetical protein ACREYE_04230, partial [Gammaproteobacteria bacterium]
MPRKTSPIQHKILNSSPPPLRHYRADIPPVLEIVMERVLAKNPTHRYQSARDFAGDLHLVFDCVLSAGLWRRRQILLGRDSSAPIEAQNPSQDCVREDSYLACG